MKKIIVLTAMIIAVAFYSKLFAQKPAVVGTNEPGWHHIGHTTASFKSQSESISVLGADEFTALKIKITEAPMHLQRMQVFYESGDMEEVDLREHFAKGTESAVINLKHPDKDIQKVAFTYHTDPNTEGEKADIDLYGLKTNQPAGRDSYKDEKAEVREEARELRDEVGDDARETRDEMREEARAAERELENDGIEIEGREEKRDLVDAVEEGAKDATAAITDRKIKNRVGPGGETAYIDDHGQLYIINNLGERENITRMQLKSKPDKD